MGEGQASGGVEPQYATAKTSVWWDIENCLVPKGCDPHAIAKNISSVLVTMNYCGPITISAYGDTTGIPAWVQRALSGTGIALNHVPAGAKDASDKKILVDMLFWAVDNPAPANYLLISGDRDFSNALHQLRMRRYNILLAQPFQASAALFAAAKCVWHWTSLANGDLPFSTGGLSKFSNASKTKLAQSYNNAATPPLEAPKSSAPPNSNKANVTRMASLPANLEESKDVRQPESIPVKKFMKAPHEFFSATMNAVPSTSSSNSNYLTDNLGNQSVQPQPPYVPDNLIPLSSHVYTLQSGPSRLDGSRPSVALPEIRNLCVSGHPSFFHSDLVNRQSGDDLRSKSMVSPNPNSSFQECQPPQPQHYVQCLIGFILLALNTLKAEKIAPTEANITDCIRYGDPKQRNIDVRKAFAYALDENMIIKQNLGPMEVYIGRTERLWACENPLGGYVEQYPNATWAAIQQFITSSEGSSALKASECRYEAALILKNSCLRTYPLGTVLRILNMIINVKQWIKNADLGWQPITITLLETEHDTTGNGI